MQEDDLVGICGPCKVRRTGFAVCSVDDVEQVNSPQLYSTPWLGMNRQQKGGLSG